MIKHELPRSGAQRFNGEFKQPPRLRQVKTSLQNRHLRNGDYFAIIAFARILYC